MVHPQPTTGQAHEVTEDGVLEIHVPLLVVADVGLHQRHRSQRANGQRLLAHHAVYEARDHTPAHRNQAQRYARLLAFDPRHGDHGVCDHEQEGDAPRTHQISDLDQERVTRQ